jgi:hypothetical protein
MVRHSEYFVRSGRERVSSTLSTALCGGLAWLIISPAAVLVARLGRHLQGTWLQLHKLFQVVLTLGLTLAAVVIAAVAVNSQGGKHFMGGHQALGLVILILLVIQLNLGWIIHKLFNAERTKRPIRNVAHMGLGMLLILLGFVQSYSGFKLYGRPTPAYVLAAFILVVIFFTLFYFGSISLLVHDRRKTMKWTWALFGLGRDAEKKQPPVSGVWGPSREKLVEPGWSPRQNEQGDDNVAELERQASMNTTMSERQGGPALYREPTLSGRSVYSEQSPRRTGGGVQRQPTSGRDPTLGTSRIGTIREDRQRESAFDRDELRTGMSYQLARSEFTQQQFQHQIQEQRRLEHMSLGR